MGNKNLYWIWLSQINGIGPITCRRLLDKFKIPENIYKASKDDFKNIDGIGEGITNKILNNKDLDISKKIIENCYKNNIEITNRYESNFPESIKKYEDMPILLYYKGNINSTLNGVSIIGTRRCSDYGKKVAVEAAKFLVENNIPVISGMAKGIDSYAHTTAIKERGYTVAVLGCGLDICYPKEHNLLMSKIIENGLVISEYPPVTKPSNYNFPKRNRLISAISEKILIVEAGENSGALITVKYAREQNKEILVVPNNIYSDESKGSNKLILEGEKIFLSNDQLLIKDRYYMENKNSNLVVNNEDSRIEKLILSLLYNKPKTLDSLISESSLRIDELIDSIINLELKDKVYKKGVYYHLEKTPLEY